jgi:hypothetical protein
MFQLLLGIFTGPLGVAVAFPLAVAGSVLIKMLYIEDMLGDPVGVPSAHRAHGGRLAGGREPL